MLIYSDRIQRLNSNANENASLDPCFLFIIIDEDECHKIPKIIPKEKVALESWLKRKNLENIRITHESLPKGNEGFLQVHPRVERLSPHLHFVRYRDIDAHGSESPIRFLMNPSVFLLIGWTGVSKERLESWVQSGLLATPMDVAKVLGTKVLAHHQERLEQFEDLMDKIEEGILKRPRPSQQGRIMVLHKRVIGIKKSLNAHLSVFNHLTNIEQGEGTTSWQELVLDTQRELDNARQTHELVESLREAYQTAVDNRANDIMKILTLLATILLPINLLTSFFGMNFENMPLIHQPYGLNIFYTSSAVIAVAVLTYFWKKRWLK